MSKSKKSTPQKQPAFSPKQMQAIAENQLKQACELMAGPGSYAKFPAYSKKLILANRYPQVKLKGADDKILEDMFRKSMNTLMIQTETGETIPAGQYLREGMMLAQYIEMMSNEGNGFSPELINAFEPYFSYGKNLSAAYVQIARLMGRYAIIQSDFSEKIMSYNFDRLCAVGSITAPNEITIIYHRPQQISISLDGNKRELLRVGWPEISGPIQWLTIPPAKLGFFHGGTEEKPVYIQRHALNRLNERLNIHPGLVHEALTELFQNESVHWKRFNEKTLVPLNILNKKLGYLVVSYDREKIIIRSFLFLTNNGTLEGNQLSKLTKLAPTDKKYLDMDNLAGFASFDFGSHPELSELFKQAGCEDLLDTKELLLFSENLKAKKDPEDLKSYLALEKSEK